MADFAEWQSQTFDLDAEADHLHHAALKAQARRARDELPVGSQVKHAATSRLEGSRGSDASAAVEPEAECVGFAKEPPGGSLVSRCVLLGAF
jgi:hypothetical protein